MTAKNTGSKSILNTRKQTLATLTVCLLAFNGWAFIQASENPEESANQSFETQFKNETDEHRGRPGHPQHPLKAPMPMSHILDKLEVSEDQRDGVREILRDERDQMYELRSGVEDQIDAGRTATMTETRKRLSAVLSEDQLAKYDEMLDRRKMAKHKKRPQPEVL